MEPINIYNSTLILSVNKSLTGFASFIIRSTFGVTYSGSSYAGILYNGGKYYSFFFLDFFPFFLGGIK